MLAFHYTGIGIPHWGAVPAITFPTLNIVSRYGYLGVHLFFVISGFVILMTAYDRSIESFSASRVARLFPAYWMAVLLTVTLQQFWHEGRNPSLVDGLVNLTMTQEAFDIVNVQGAFWTLWIELKFYLLIGVFVLIGVTRRRVLAFAVLWPLIGQIAVATKSSMLVSLLIPTYAPYFAAGILMFLLYRERHDMATWLALVLNWILCIRQSTEYADRASELVRATVSPLVVATIVTLSLAAVLLCSSGLVARIQWRWLTTAGALTYPLYLVHGQLGFFLIDTLHEDLNTYLLLLIATLSALVLAYLINRLVERPLAPRLRRGVQEALEPTPTGQVSVGRASPEPVRDRRG